MEAGGPSHLGWTSSLGGRSAFPPKEPDTMIPLAFSFNGSRILGVSSWMALTSPTPETGFLVLS